MVKILETEKERKSQANVRVCCVIIGIHKQKGPEICLIKRFRDPEKGKWALPGGPVVFDQKKGIKETFLDVAYREIKRDVGIEEKLLLRQFQTFEDPNSSSDCLKVVIIGLYGLINPYEKLKSEVKSKDAHWFPIENLPDMAFHHDEVAKIAVSQVKKDIIFHPIFKDLLPKEFAISELQMVFEKIFKCKFNSGNFATKMRKSCLLEKAKEPESSSVAYRPPTLYRVSDKLDSLEEPLGLPGFITSFIPTEEFEKTAGKKKEE